MSARHERHECDTSDTSETRAAQVRHKCDTNDTLTTRVRHECYTNDTSAIRVKNFDFDNDTSKGIFSHPYIYYIASERLQGEKQFHSKSYLLEMPRFHTKMRLKSVLQKLNFLMAKAISKRCTLDYSCKCPCTFPPKMFGLQLVGRRKGYFLVFAFSLFPNFKLLLSKIL